MQPSATRASGGDAMALNERQDALCEASRTDFSDLRALIFDCTWRRPEVSSHTGLPLSVPGEFMRRNGVAVEVIRPATLPSAFGVQPDMREHGWPEDAWPEIWEKVLAAD